MDTITKLAAAFAKLDPSWAGDVEMHCRRIEDFYTRKGYTITITPPLTVAAWRIDMQRICRVILDIDKVLNSGGLTEHEIAHNNALRKLWEDRADAHRAAYPGSSTFDVWAAKQLFDNVS